MSSPIKPIAGAIVKAAAEPKLKRMVKQTLETFKRREKIAPVAQKAAAQQRASETGSMNKYNASQYAGTTTADVLRARQDSTAAALRKNANGSSK